MDTKTQISSVLMWGWNFFYGIFQIIWSFSQWISNSKSLSSQTKVLMIDLEEAIKEPEVPVEISAPEKLGVSKNVEIPEPQEEVSKSEENSDSEMENNEERVSDGSDQEDLTKEAPSLPTPIQPQINSEIPESKEKKERESKEGKKKRRHRSRKSHSKIQAKNEISEKNQDAQPILARPQEHPENNKWRPRGLKVETPIFRDPAIIASSIEPIPMDTTPRRYAHSVLKHEPVQRATLESIIRPVRQPLGPDGSHGFSDSYKKSRRINLTVV